MRVRLLFPSGRVVSASKPARMSPADFHRIVQAIVDARGYDDNEDGRNDDNEEGWPLVSWDVD